MSRASRAGKSRAPRAAQELDHRLYSLPMTPTVKNSRRGSTTVSSKHQVTIPKQAMVLGLVLGLMIRMVPTNPIQAMVQAGLRAGDRLRAVARGRGRVLLVREDDPVARHAGTLTGAYGPHELDELRDEWR